MPAARGEADILIGIIALSEAPTTAEGAALDAAETKRLGSMSGPIRPREFLGGRFLAKSMAARLLGVDLAEIRIEVEEKGRPLIAAPERLSVGLTHTRDYAACALSRSGVGLDLEELGRKGELRGVEEYAFGPGERAALAAGPDRERRFFEIWTLKEAYLKLNGIGVPEIKRAPTFELGPDGAVVASGGSACGYLSFALGASVIGALAYERAPGKEPGPPPRIAFDPRFAPPPGLDPRLLRGDGEMTRPGR